MICDEIIATFLAASGLTHSTWVSLGLGESITDKVRLTGNYLHSVLSWVWHNWLQGKKIPPPGTRCSRQHLSEIATFRKSPATIPNQLTAVALGNSNHVITCQQYHFQCVISFPLHPAFSWEVTGATNERRKSTSGEREKAHGLQAVKLWFVVLDQAICKHEGAVLRKIQKEGKKNENENIERETKEKWRGTVGWWGADSGHGEILPSASNSCLCATRRREEIVWEATKALWKPSSMCQGNK